MIRTALPALLAMTLAGCASSMSGLGGTERYACRAPEGAQCTSVSGVYANTLRGALPSAQAAQPSESAAPAAAYAPAPLPKAQGGAPGLASAAIRSAPRLLRVWIAPWEDSDGDLHEASTVHLLADSGRWLIEHVRPATPRRAFAVTPPAAANPAPPAARPAGEAPAPVERLPLGPGEARPPGEASPEQP